MRSHRAELFLSAWEYVSARLHALVWTCAAAALVVFGNGQFDLFTLCLATQHVNRPFIIAALACAATNGALFCYTYMWLPRVSHDPLNAFPALVPVGTAAGLVGWIWWVELISWKHSLQQPNAHVTGQNCSVWVQLCHGPLANIWATLTCGGTGEYTS